MFWKSSSSFLLHLKYGISESLCQPTWEFPHLWVSYNEVLHYYCLNLFHLDLLLLEAKHILTDPVLSGSLLSVCAQSLQLCPTLCDPLDWTVAHQAPLSMGFSRQEYWSGLSCLLERDLLDPGIVPVSLSLQVYSLPPEPPGKPRELHVSK